MLNQIFVKPMSVNEVWQGKRFKTKAYDIWREQILLLLPRRVNDHFVGNNKMVLMVEFGVSSKTADLDNLLKPFIDCLQIRYGFDDRQIYRIGATKRYVPKGSEFIRFDLEEFVENSLTHK